MIEFKEGYYWVKYKSGNYVEWIKSESEMKDLGFEQLQYIGENYNEFIDLFKRKAS